MAVAAFSAAVAGESGSRAAEEPSHLAAEGFRGRAAVGPSHRVVVAAESSRLAEVGEFQRRASVETSRRAGVAEPSRQVVAAALRQMVAAAWVSRPGVSVLPGVHRVWPVRGYLRSVWVSGPGAPPRSSARPGSGPR